MPFEQHLSRLVVAAVLGSLIGPDRERLDRAAGLRRPALVSTASALIIAVPAYGLREVINGDPIALDPRGERRVAVRRLSPAGGRAER